MKSDLLTSGKKILRHADRLAPLIAGDVESTVPVTAHVYLTNACNHDCAYCSEIAFRRAFPATMDRGFALDLMADLAKAGVRSVVFTGGGEPTLHADFATIVAKAHDEGLKVGLITNGSAASIVDAAPHLSWLRVSMDGGNAELYAQIRRVAPAEFDRVLDNVRKVREENPELVIGVHFLASRENVDVIPSFLDRIDECGATFATLKVPVAMPWFDAQRLDPEELRRVARHPRLRTQVAGDRDEPKNAGLPCWASRLNAVIAADGCVYVCCRWVEEARYEEALLGDIREAGGFLEVWRSPRAVERARSLLDAKATERCPECWMTKFNRTIAEVQPEELVSLDFI